jgi:rhodanese-related sulfurtransferase
LKKVLTALFVTCLLGATSFADTSTYPDITKNDLQAAMKVKKVVLLDCSGTESYKSGHIPGAIDYEANTDHMARVLPKDKTSLVVAYCGGPKSHDYVKGARSVSALGYRNVKHFSPGISGWTAAKLPVEKKR